MKHLAPLALLAIATCGVPYPAQAQGPLAYTAIQVNLRAGPARDYPIVAVLPAGYALAVQGCLPGYAWCDVIAGPVRGWLYAGNINYFYQNTYVPVLNYGAVIGIGLLGFVLNDYWGSYYPDRPFYRDRHRWASHRAPPGAGFAPRRPIPAPQIGQRRPPPPSSFPHGAAPRAVNPGFAPRPAPGAVHPGTVRPPSARQLQPGATPRAGRPAHGGAHPGGRFPQGERGDRATEGPTGNARPASIPMPMAARGA
jgi:uncharacterized protein YraI